MVLKSRLGDYDIDLKPQRRTNDKLDGIMNISGKVRSDDELGWAVSVGEKVRSDDELGRER